MWDYQHKRTVIASPSTSNVVSFSFPDLSASQPNTYQAASGTKFILATYAVMDASGTDFISKYTVPISPTLLHSSSSTNGDYYPPVVTGIQATITGSANLASNQIAGIGLDLRSEGNTEAQGISIGSAIQKASTTVTVLSPSGTAEDVSCGQWIATAGTKTSLNRVGLFAYCVTDGTADTCTVQFTVNNPTLILSY